jgi:hypothetical protein
MRCITLHFADGDQRPAAALIRQLVDGTAPDGAV